MRFSRENERPVLRALFVITPHAIEPIAQNAFLQVHRKIIKAFSTLRSGATRPHTYYSPEVDFGGFVSESHRHLLEKSADYFKRNGRVKGFVRHAADEAYQRGLPFKILSRERTVEEVRKLLELSRGSLTSKEVATLLDGKVEQSVRGNIFNKLIASIEEKAQNETGEEKPNTRALQLNSWTNQDKTVDTLLDGSWLEKGEIPENESGEREVRSILSFGTGHESSLDTLERRLELGHGKWSKVIPHFVVIDADGNLLIDSQLHTLIPTLAAEIGAKPVESIREVKLLDGYPETQHVFAELERKARESSKKKSFWQRLFSI